MIRCKRAYQAPSPEDGYRVLIDRLWPRGKRKDSLALDAWLADVAPSAELRKAFKVGTMQFEEFSRRYRGELAAHPENWWSLLEIAERGTLTLVYAARDEQQNNAQVLAEWLEQEGERLERHSSPACMAGEIQRRLSDDD
ncbi:DUF488 family protein [Pseudomonas stutzeri]|uniref:DUF488 domain-containing protein n=1 Tax=Stutzerimonas stutzeri TaxID=316 RepID=A0A2N8S4Y3_STUST|nr:DUF488 family protein [Stutzerimonas stutzeri]MCQ4296841.1 DUF488 family protein [Stutzerimonas stutzeri]PNF81686.1 DUF488 domain-containing protein [Stutzerimonas stutzeri]